MLIRLTEVRRNSYNEEKLEAVYLNTDLIQYMRRESGATAIAVHPYTYLYVSETPTDIMNRMRYG